MTHIPQKFLDAISRVSDRIGGDWVEITEYWIKHNKRDGNRPLVPRVRFDAAYTAERGALAVTSERDACIVFSPDVLSLGEDALECLLAHELAHTYHAAKGTTGENEEAEERQAVTTMKSWGYDDSVIDEDRIRTKFGLEAPDRT